MAKLYTRKQINETLKDLQIKAIESKVTSQEAASILTWRARHEFQAEHTYTDAIVRRHVKLGNLKDIKRLSSRHSLYSVDELFEIPLKPRHKKSIAEREENTQDTVPTK